MIDYIVIGSISILVLISIGELIRQNRQGREKALTENNSTASPPPEKSIRRDFRHRKFEDGNLTENGLDNCELEQSTFEHLDLPLYFSFSDSNLNNVRFFNVGMEKSTFYNSRMYDVHFNQCNLEKLKFQGAHCELWFENTYLDRARFTKLNYMDLNFRNCVIDECDFEGSTGSVTVRDSIIKLMSESDFPNSTQFVDCEFR